MARFFVRGGRKFRLEFVVKVRATDAAIFKDPHAADVERVQRVHPSERQPIPRLHLLGQILRAFIHHDVNDDGKKADQNQRDADDGQRYGAGDGKPQNCCRNEAKHHEQVEDGEPSVTGRRPAQNPAQSQRESGEGDRVKEQDSGNVEEKVTERDLERLLLTRGEGCQDGRRSRANV